MNVKISAPHGCKSSSILLSDIIRIECRSLVFFEQCAYNLYIVEKRAPAEEYFSLFCYDNEKDMHLAYDTIAALLKAKSTTNVVTLDMEPLVLM